MPLTDVLSERETSVVLEVAKVAVSADQLGGPPAVQFVAVLRSPVTGRTSHVALPAKLLLAVESRSVRIGSCRQKKAHARQRRSEGDTPRSDEAMPVAFFIVSRQAPKRVR